MKATVLADNIINEVKELARSIKAMGIQQVYT